MSSSGIMPVGHHVLVLPEQVQEKTAGGIYLPQQTKDREQGAVVKGEVVGIGPNAWKAFDDGSPWAEVGDIVVFAKYGGFEVEGADGKKYRLLNDEDIIAVTAYRADY